MLNRKAARNAVLAIQAFVAGFGMHALAQQNGAAIALVYDSQTRGPVPIPPSELPDGWNDL